MNNLNSIAGRYRIVIRMVLFLVVGLALFATSNAVWAQTKGTQPDNLAVIIEINPSLSPAGLTVVTRQIDEALDKNCQTIVFEFSGHGLSFEGFADLARQVDRLAQENNIRTVAYIPKDALQMSMLAVFACRQIVADDFAP